MLLSAKHPLLCTLVMLGLSSQVHAQDSNWQDFSYQYNVHIGFDYWDIEQQADSARLKRLAYLPDGDPQWSYRNPSPWIHFDSSSTLSSSLSSNFKFRGNQTSDWRVDELNLSWSIAPSWGITAGVVDYKTSWCRSYDVDSIWVRENDPFCTVRTTEQGTGAAPGVQFYLNGQVNDHLWQAQVGWFDPLLWDYDTKEFNLQALVNDSRVKKNQKQGISFNSVHLPTGSEIRLGYLRTQQVADYQPGPNLAFYDKPQDVDVYFLGLAFPTSPTVKLRFTHLQSDLKSRFFPTDGIQAPWIFDVDFLRESYTAEIYWQISPLDSVALGHSWYEWNELVNITNKSNHNTKHQLNRTDFRHKVWSMSWRRDWNKNFYTALQWTEAKAQELDLDIFQTRPTDRRSDGRALGLRMGFRF